MRKRIVAVLFVILLDSQAGLGANMLHLPICEDEQSLESRVIDALLRGNSAEWQNLRRALDSLGHIRRNELPFRLWRGTVEFVFDGVYPHGSCNPESLEYAVSLPEVKDHETLLVI